MNASAQKILEKKFSKGCGSYWIETASFPATEELHENIKADVAVIGGGITGLTAAYLLARAGKNVVLLESKPLGEGDTGHTSAHLTSVVDPRYAVIEKYHGADAARQVFRNQVMAINWMESFALEEKIDCNFHRVNGYLFLGEKQKLNGLEEEWRALNTAGCSDAIWLQDIGVEAFRGKPAMRIHGQARFHPLKYLAGMAEAFQAQGGKIYTGAAAQKINNGEIITARGFKVSAEKIIVATHSPIAGTFIFLKQAAYRTYVIGARIQKNSFPDALFWDTCDPYHYIRVEPGETFDLLIIGGEDRKTGESTADEEPFQKLEEWARRKFKGMIQSVDYYWSGQVLEAADGLPYIGVIPYREHSLYMATGFSGNGLTYGTLAGHILRDLVLGIENRSASLYKPVRKNIFSWREFLKENFDALKKLVLGWTVRDAMDLEKLQPEQGAVVSQGIKKVAVYRNAAGRLIKVSAICPHLGCMVQWNREEKTFDCPCHGSRFDCEGKVMQGPAHKDLTPLS